MFKKLIPAFTFLFSAAALADIAIIVHPSNGSSLTQEDVVRLYTGKSSNFSDGSKAVPLNLSESDTLRGNFDEKALSRSSSQVKAYWSKLIFTGKGTPPKEVSNEAEMIDLISKNPNLVGYVSSGAVTGSVKSVLVVQ